MKLLYKKNSKYLAGIKYSCWRKSSMGTHKIAFGVAVFCTNFSDNLAVLVHYAVC